MKKRFSRNTIIAIGLSGVVLLLLVLLAIWWRNQPRIPVLPQPPLRDLAAKHNLQLGNHAILNRLGEKPYATLLSQQFNFVLADNTPNWYFTDGGLRPSSTHFNFDQMDQVMKFAESHNMPVQAHHYLWGEEKWLPEWLKDGNYTKDQLLQLIHDHIQVVGGKYSGKIREWTVVNEAFSRGQNIYGLRDWWADHIGDRQAYLDNAFVWARQADPHSKLILNDFQNEGMNPISNAMFEYIKNAKSRGIPIDGIGMQMHIDGTHPPVKDEVIANMRRFGKLGVKVYVTEFDVNMNDVQASSEAKDKIAGTIYYEMLRACIESKVCDSFAILGISDKETWYNHLGLPDPRPLPFDKEYDPKPAYFSMRTALEQD